MPRKNKTLARITPVVQTLILLAALHPLFAGAAASSVDAGQGSENTQTTITLPPTLLPTDTQPPVITVPPDVTKEATGPQTVVDIGYAGAIDDTDGLVPVQADRSGPFSVGRHLITWRATDKAGNAGTEQQVVTITDTTAPTVNAPATVHGLSDWRPVSVELGQATARDLVDGQLVATPDNAGPFTLGEHTVVWSATDKAGNRGTAKQTVIIDWVPTADRKPPVVSPPADIVVESTGKLTPVVLGTAHAVDEIDGELAVSTEDLGPFKQGKHQVVWKARNTAGKVGQGIQIVTVLDATSPVLTLSDDHSPLKLDAQGPRTVVSDFGIAIADEADAGITLSGLAYPLVEGKAAGQPKPVTADGFLVLPSGRHEIVWTATDSSGNQGQLRQRVDIVPRVEWLPTPLAAPGEAVDVRVALSGEAAVYPVTIPYVIDVSSTAQGNGLDHDAQDGVMVIEKGTQGRFRFNVPAEPGFTGVGAEYLDFIQGEPENAQSGVAKTHRVIFTRMNRQPEVDLVIRQDDQGVTTVVRQAGKVVVTALAQDADHDPLLYDWSLTDSQLGDIQTDDDPATLELDPFNIRAGSYTLAVTVSDGGEPRKETTTTAVLVVAEGKDIIADRDADGIADKQDGIERPNLLQGRDNENDYYLLQSEPGTRLVLGSRARKRGQFSARLASAVLAGLPDGRVASTIYDVEVHDALPGQSRYLVLPQATPLPADAAYFTHGVVWSVFQEDDLNRLYSASSDKAGLCPPPRSQRYQPGLKVADTCVQVLIEDGGTNDVDETVNGVVVHTGAILTGGEVDEQAEKVLDDAGDKAPERENSDLSPATPVTPVVNSAENQGGGGGSWFGGLWILLVLRLFFLRHRFSGQAPGRA